MKKRISKIVIIALDWIAKNLSKVVVGFMCVCVFAFHGSPQAVAKANPEKDFSPEKFFLFKLKNPDSPDLTKWYEAYEKYVYQQAEAEKYSYFDKYAKYTTLDPDSKHLSKIFDKLFKKEDKLPTDFVSKVNFVLYEEYRRRYPTGKYVNAITPQQLLENERKYLREIYLSESVEHILEVARSQGIAEQNLADMIALQQEIQEFERVDIHSEEGCEAFIAQYPGCPHVELVRECLFMPLQEQFWAAYDPGLIDKLIYWIPKARSKEFYTRVWNELVKESQEKSAEEQLHILNPWILSTRYRYASHAEKIFLTDVLSQAAMLHIKAQNTTRAALSNLTAAATFHLSFPDLNSLLFAAFNADFSNLQELQKLMEENKQKVSRGRQNIRTGRSLLSNLGVASYFANSLDFLTQLSQIESATQEEKDQIVESVKAQIREETAEKDDYIESCLQNLANMLGYDKDAWPALQTFTLFPDQRPLESIMLMPRFYDYEDHIEEYLNKFKQESIDVANQWLADPMASDFQRARALFVLGFHQTPYDPSIEVDRKQLGKHDFFYDYYVLRAVNPNDVQHREHLINAASEKNRIALVLYNKTKGDTQTPPALKDWLFEEIEKEKYDDNEVLHIFHPIIEGLPSADQVDLIDKMYNAYNVDWKDIASTYYATMIPQDISPETVTSILEGAIPWKKLTLIKTLIQRGDPQYQDIIVRYLEGQYYTEGETGDQGIIRRNLKNLFTKDIVLGFNQQINWSVVNKAVDRAEKRYKAMLILDTVEGLNILPFDRAVEVITSRFLHDELLCIPGARWILKNFDPQTQTQPDVSVIKVENSSLQSAVVLLLQAYFSDNPDYSQYVEASKQLKEHEQWSKLVELGAEYAEMELFKQDTKTSQIVNPMDDLVMDKLLSNVKSRFLLLLAGAK